MDQDTTKNTDGTKTLGKIQPSNTFQSKNADESIATSQEPSFETESRANLLNWKYLPHGQRLPIFEQKIPHVNDLEYKALEISKIRNLIFETSITDTAKDIISFYTSTKKRFIELSEEYDILKWHIANSSNELKLNEGVLLKLDNDHFNLEQKLKTVTEEVKRYEEENKILNEKLSEQREQYENIMQDATLYKDAVTEKINVEDNFLQQLVVNRRNTYTERCRRLKQWKKLEREIALDNKVHLRAYCLQENGKRLRDAYQFLQTSLIGLQF